MVIVIDASSLHHSFKKEQRNTKEWFRLSKQVIKKYGFNPHPNAKDKLKIVKKAIAEIFLTDKSQSLARRHTLTNP